MAGETLICDTSFVWHLWRRERTPARYGHWDRTAIVAPEMAVEVVYLAPPV
jgi:hypothetical protein